jgi:hypothetical protein
MILFHLQSYRESNTKEVEDFPIFPTVIYFPSSVQQFATAKGKYNLGMFGWDSFLEMNTKNVENSPRFPSVAYSASSGKRFRSYIILKIENSAEICLEQNSS